MGLSAPASRVRSRSGRPCQRLRGGAVGLGLLVFVGHRGPVHEQELRPEQPDTVGAGGDGGADLVGPADVRGHLDRRPVRSSRPVRPPAPALLAAASGGDPVRPDAREGVGSRGRRRSRPDVAVEHHGRPLDQREDVRRRRPRSPGCPGSGPGPPRARWDRRGPWRCRASASGSRCAVSAGVRSAATRIPSVR